MIDLVRKRHGDPGWIVIEEVGNSTGGNVRRHADAVAIGIWPSRGYEIHGYELKQSRGDVQKELMDPSKADAVGKFCDYWWLVVSDLKIIDGLVIPEAWGILVPRNSVLRVHRKAPKRKDVTPIHRGFSAAIIRCVVNSWVPRHEHAALKASMEETIAKEVEKRLTDRRDDDAHELKELRAAVKRFEEKTGVEITTMYNYGSGQSPPRPKNTWELDRIADAVKVVIKAREVTGRDWEREQHEPIALLNAERDSVRRAIDNIETALARRKGQLFNLDQLAEEMAAAPPEPAPATAATATAGEDRSLLP